MNTDIHLLNVPELDINHNHTFSFGTKEQQLNYFLSKKVQSIENVNYHRKNNNLKVNFHIDELQFVNYIMINNEIPLNKWYYYFVIDRRYINEHCTELILKLDVMQTYLFNFSLTECLVERMHYNRYNSDGSVNKTYFKTEDTLDTGEYIREEVPAHYTYNKKGSFIICSSDMLGYDDKRKQSTPPPSTDESHGRISANIFRFLKGYEAYSASAYQDSGGVWTIGYGITQSSYPDYYNSLLTDCSEEKASNYLYEVANGFYNGIINPINEFRNNPKQNEIDAFVSLAYNCGVHGCQSSPMYQAYISNKPLSECASDWSSYYIRDAAGNTLQGLIDRRNKEVNIFLNASYEMKPIQNMAGGYITSNDGNGYIPTILKWIGNNDSGNTSSVVESARKLIGKPYIYGGNYPPLGSHTGTDCSGLCEWAYQDAGIQTGLPHRWTTYTMYDYTSIISLSEAKAGDVIYTNFVNGKPSHVRIFVSATGDNVRYVGAENEDIGIIESTMTFDPNNHKIGRF